MTRRPPPSVPRTCGGRWPARSPANALLWLAYAQGSSHKEIAESLGLRAGSVKLLLFPRAAPAGRAADRHASRRTGKDPAVKLQCPFEQELLDAVAARRWPDRAEPALRTHVASCSLCSDVAEIAGAFFEDRDCARAEAVVPRARSGGKRRFAPAKKPRGWRSVRCWSSR